MRCLNLKRCAIAIFALAVAGCAVASQTENIAFRVLPAPGKMVIDGKIDDWDLSGGIFACDDVEEQREHFAIWLHAQYDAQNLYLLARWIDDTPMNNPGQTIADYGFNADCLQFRTITAAGTPQERGQHFTAWHGRDGADVIKIEQGTTFKEGVVVDAKKTDGAQQAFAIGADGRSYTQEIAIPWKLLTRDGVALKAGDAFTLTFEPNFTIGTKGRLTVKDLFKAGMTPDRVFTFMAHNCWGTAKLEAKGGVAPQPVRLADAREFAVKLENGLPVVDWTGLIKSKELPGFIPIEFTMPADGYISLNLKSADGRVARQLLNQTFFAKGKHTVKWDGLTTPSWTRPGEPVAAGEYTWSALTHPGIGLKLRGWACNGGNAPWDSADGKGNWGGDHGIPSAVATDATQVYLGWSGAEAGKSLIACDLKGNVQWGNNRGGIAGVKGLAVDDGVLYVLGGLSGPDAEGAAVYKLNTKDGSYLKWEGSESADLKIATVYGGHPNEKAERAHSIAAANGKIYLSFKNSNQISVADGKTGKFIQKMDAKAPGKLALKSGILYVLSGDTNVEKLSLTENSNPNPPKKMAAAKPDSAHVSSFTIGNNQIFESFGEPLNYVSGHHDADELAAKILDFGHKGGRALLGPWNSDGVRFVHDMALDAEGKLWVVEADGSPKRISVWNTLTLSLVNEFFGPSSYGALGGAISPLDPNIMVGQGCEWKLDPATGRAKCTGVITRDGMENARFGVGSNGKLYLACATRWAFDLGAVNIFERVGEGDYKLRSSIWYVDNDGKDIPPPAHGKVGAATKTAMWADENGDGVKQPNEVTISDGIIRVTGWYMFMNQDLTFYGAGSGKGAETQFKVAGFSACGAPKYELSKPVKLPIAGLGSPDGKLVLQNGVYNQNHSLFTCADIATGQTRWTYPDNFTGVHGSHNACPPEVGMIRGSFGPTGSAKLPAPLGNIWVIPTNVGEWHILTEDGFYLTRLFEGDPMKVKWPDQAQPGADMTHTPPGMGGEDFGGSIIHGADGKLYIQAGKTAYWNLEVTGLDRVQAIAGTSVKVSEQDVVTARKMREELLQASVGSRKLAVKNSTPKFTGNFDADFKGAEFAQFHKTEETKIRAAAAWDDKNLYLAWDVRDKTPWINGAEAAESLYLGGDTVDFQLGTDAKADAKRDKAGLGDLRLSIGNFKGTPTAVVYRPVASKDKNRMPKTFSSGVIKEYVVADVATIADAQIKVTKRGDSYLIEASIPLSALEFTPAAGQTLRGDFGATFGDPAGQRTRLRSYWSNQHTGLVDDAVFELMLEPKNWGEITFQ